MKKTKLKFLVAAVAAVLVLILTCAFFPACGEEEPEPAEVVLTSIELDTSKVQLEFDYGETFNSNNLVVYAVMSDGSKKSVSASEYRISTPDTTKPGTRYVSVNYEGKSARYSITVNERVMPEIDKTALFEITGEVPNASYRVEAENINLTVSGVQANGGELIIGDENVSGGKYLANYGVETNYFGFTFTAERQYDDVTLVLHMANPNTSSLQIASSMNLHLNYKNVSEAGTIDISALTALSAAEVTEPEEGEPVVTPVWEDRIVRGLTIPAGSNSFTFEIIGENVPYIDYVEFYVDKLYGNSRLDITEATEYVKEFEDFDLEKIVVRQDIKDHYGLGDGEAFIEVPSTNLENTSGGKSVGAFIVPTEISTIIGTAQPASVRIAFAAACVDSIKVKDCFEFYIDGERLTDIEDINIKGGDPAKMQYWEWVDTSLGIVDLAPGDHLFTVKMVGGSSLNADCFKFEVLTYGEYYDPSAVPPYTVSVSSSGTKYTVEAEDLDCTEGRMIETPAGNAYQITSGYSSLAPDAEAGNMFRFNVSSEAAAKARLDIYAAHGGDALNFDDSVEIKAGDTVVTTGAVLSKDEGAESYTYTDPESETEVKEKAYTYGEAYRWNWKKISVDIDLAAGDNMITFTVKEGAVSVPNFDKFDIIVTKYGDGEEYVIPEIMKEDCAGVIPAEEGTTRVEAEDMDFGSAILHRDNLYAGQRFTETASGAAASITSGLVVGKMSVQGNKFVLNVYSEAEQSENVSIRFSMAVGDTVSGEPWKADDLLTFTLNDTPFTAGDEAVFTGYNTAYQYWNWQPFVVKGLSLVQGVNTLEIVVKDKCPNMDYFEFIVGEYVEEADVTVTEAATYVMEGENCDLSDCVLQAGWDHIAIETPGTTDPETSGGKSLGAIGENSKITVSVSTGERATIRVLARVAKFEGGAASNYVNAVFGEQALTPTGNITPGSDSNQFYNWTEIELGTVTVDAGTYECTFTLTGSPNVDCFKFVVDEYGTTV